MLSYVNEAEAQTNIKRHGTGYARTSSSRLHTDKDLSVVSRRMQILAFFHSASHAGAKILDDLSLLAFSKPRQDTDLKLLSVSKSHLDTNLRKPDAALL